MPHLPQTPCDLEGEGFLEPVTTCPVEAGHYARAVVGGLGVMVTLLASGSGFVFVVTGRALSRRGFAYGAGVALAILVVWWIVVFAIPSVLPIRSAE